MKQTCILILGMHRSGTSALTGMLSMLDVYLGSELMESNKHNEKGYFENSNFYKINDELLSGINSSWEDIFYNEEKLAKFNNSLELISKLKNIIIEQFNYSNIFAIKDPRIVYLFPIYKKVLDELNINIKIIIPYRNPIEVARSLTRRDNFSLEKGMLLWAYHIILAEKFSRKYQRIFINYENIINNSEEVINNLSELLELDLHSKYEQNIDQINRFLDPGLQHHSIPLDKLSKNTPAIIIKILSLRDEFNSEGVTKKFDSLKEELFSYQKLFFNEEVINAIGGFILNRQIVDQKKEELLLIKEELRLIKEELFQKTHMVEQANNALKQKDEEIASIRTELNRQIGNLKQTQHSLQVKEKRLTHAQTELLRTNNQKKLLEDELISIYTSRSWKLIRIIKKIGRHTLWYRN